MSSILALPLICCFGGLLLVVGMVALFAVWIVSIVDVLQRTDGEFPSALGGNSSPNEKLTWVLVTLLAGPLGGLVYRFMVMKPYPRYVRPSVSAPEQVATNFRPPATLQQPVAPRPMAELAGHRQPVQKMSGPVMALIVVACIVALLMACSMSAIVAAIGG